MVPSLELGAIFLSRQLTMAFLLNVLRKNAYSPRVTLHVTFTVVSLLGLMQSENTCSKCPIALVDKTFTTSDYKVGAIAPRLDFVSRWVVGVAESPLRSLM